jgi:hypothetical protein
MRAALRAVPGLFWLGAFWVVAGLWVKDIRGIYIAVFCVVLGTVQMWRTPDFAFAASGDERSEGLAAGEVLSAVFICLAAVAAAAYGWLSVGTVWAAVGGAVMVGIFALLLVSLAGLAGAGLRRLFRGREGR